MTTPGSHGANGSVQDERSFSGLLSDLAEQTGRLVRTEARLAAREMATKATRGAGGVGALSAAGILAGYAAFALVLCVIFALSMVMAGWLAALLVGGALLAAAGVAALIGRARLRRAMPPVPDETIERVRADISAVAEHVSEHGERA
jgi:hypothetical protein